MGTGVSSRRLLDPLERTSEILFGLIMVLTFTSSLSVAGVGRDEARTVLVGAIACNLAWGLVDATMYLLANVVVRARGVAVLRAIRRAREPEAERLLILDALPEPVATSLTPAEIETLRQRLRQQPDYSRRSSLRGRDMWAALGVFLLVFLSTFPVVVPFLVVRNPRTAMRASNAVAVILLFIVGRSLGKYAGGSGWRTGLGMVALGLVLVGITIALGG